MLAQGIPLFDVAIHERDAYRAIFSYGGSLSGLSASAVGGIPAAAENARKFVAEVVGLLKKQQTAEQAEVV